MYEKVNITENHLQVLVLFTRGFGREYYIREVQKLLKISPRTAQLILGDLESKGVLESETRGKIRVYRLRKNETTAEYLILTEHYKALSFLGRRPMIKEIVSKITSLINGMGLIFGSYAKGTEKKGSDLDVFVAGECDRSRIKKVSELYGIAINIKNYPKKIFEKELKKDVLLKEVLDSHIVFTNADEFVRLVLKDE